MDAHWPPLWSSAELSFFVSPLSEVLVDVGVQGDNPQVGQYPQYGARQAHAGHLPPARQVLSLKHHSHIFLSNKQLTIVT